METIWIALERSLRAVSGHWFPFAVYALLLAAMAGRVGRGMGLANILHDDPAMAEMARERGWTVWLSSPTLLAQIGLALYMALAWGFARTLELDGAPLPDGLRLGPDVGPQIALTAALAALVSIRTARPGAEAVARGEAARAVIGAALGLVLAWGLIRAASAFAPHLAEAFPAAAASTIGTAALAVPGAAAMVMALSLRRLNTALALISLFALLLILYALVSAFPDWAQLWVIVLLGVAVLLGNGLFMGRGDGRTRFKFEIPNIVDAEGRSLYGGRQARIAERYLAAGTETGGAGVSDKEGDEAAPQEQAARTRVRRAGAIDPLEALEAWAGRAPAGASGKPRLVLLACSGGAYRAAFWTGLVLDRLTAMEADGLDGFGRSLRMITGASGGMVGAAYFAALARPDGPTPPVIPRLEEDILAVRARGGVARPDGSVYDPAPGYPFKRANPIPRDSLSPVAQQLVQRDLPGLFSRKTRRVDRGVVLEDQWATLDQPFDALAPGEAEGWRPSLVFSPMLAETGQPLLISNLDMAGVRPDPTADGSETVEFRDWFPDAMGAFRVKTAVRLNAAFPYIAPSAALPTIPYRRVVDAGYYDNYGVDLAVSFLSRKRVRDWVIARCAGVMLVQTRAFPFPTPSARQPAPLARGFQWLTTPLDAAVAARGSTMTFRNRQSLRRLADAYADRLGREEPGRFLRTARFEVASDTSLSWYLPGRELAGMAGDAEAGTGLESPGNREAFDAMRAFWAET